MFKSKFLQEYSYEKLPKVTKDILFYVDGLQFAESHKVLAVFREDAQEALEYCNSCDEKDDRFLFFAFLNFFKSYVDVWDTIVNGKPSSIWASLQDCISLLELVARFSVENKLPSGILFLSSQLLSIEQLFPFPIFISAGLIVDYYECSICGNDIDGVECNHLLGHLYCGEYANGTARNVEIDHVSIVERPNFRCCTIQYSDDDLFFNSARVLQSFLLSKKYTPLQIYGYDLSIRQKPNPDCKKLGRNDRCYCNSQLKFKKCCINKRFIEYKHVELIMNDTLLHYVMKDRE